MPQPALTNSRGSHQLPPPQPHTFPGLVPLEVLSLEGKGEDVTLGEGNLKKMGRSSHGTELGDMGTRARRPSGLFTRTNRAGFQVAGAANREPGEPTCS